MLDLLVLRRHIFDPVAEGMHAAMPGAMDEADRPRLRQRFLQHGQGRGDADAGGDQHQRLVAVTQDEIASRRKQIQLVALGDPVMQVIGDPSTRLALDADAVFAAVAGSGKRIVAAHFLAVDVQPQADVLSRLERQQRLAVHRLQVERGDFLALRLLACHAEAPHTAPAAIGLGAGGIHRLLGLDQQVGQLLVGRAPGFEDFVGGDLFAEDLADRPQQASADDRIVFGQHLQETCLFTTLATSGPSSCNWSMCLAYISTPLASAAAGRRWPGGPG